MDIPSIIVSLVVGGISGLAGATIGSYYGSYNKRKGEIFAEYEDFATIIAQESRKAYEQESAKRLATHEDIENVLAEVRKVTTETESIKAQISGDAWLRQTVWVQKRGAYAEVLKALGESWAIAIEVGARVKGLERRRGEGTQEEALSELKAQLEDRRKDFLNSMVPLFQRFSEAELFDPDISKLRLEVSNLKSITTFGDPGSEENAYVELTQFQSRVVDHMRKELGIGRVGKIGDSDDLIRLSE